MAEAGHHDKNYYQNNQVLLWTQQVADTTLLGAPKRAAVSMTSPPRSPSPAKRQRRQPALNQENMISDGQNIGEATPRPIRGRALDMGALARNTPSADSTSPSVTSSLTSSLSRRSRPSTSPRKRALALLQADDLPVTRKTMAEIHSYKALPDGLRNLLRDVTTIRTRRGIFPGQLKQYIETTSDMLVDPVSDYMFDGNGSPGHPHSSDMLETTIDKALSSGLFDLLYVHRRIVDTVVASSFCADSTRPASEVEWNDRVHACVLDIAFQPAESLVYRNITAASPALAFRDPDPRITDNKVDYAIFLAPSATSPLKWSIASYMRAQRRLAGGPILDQLNMLQQIEADRPMAVALETKRDGGGDGHGPNQLANWARIHFRHLRMLKRSLSPEINDLPPDDFSALPLIEVQGARWTLKLAFYQSSTQDHDLDGAVVIYDGLPLGSTESMTDCYGLILSLRRIGIWCEREYTQAWQRVLDNL